MKVIVFDPGLTTGVVSVNVSDERSQKEEGMLVEIRETMKLYHIKFPNEQYGAMKLWDCICAFAPDLIIGEDFRLFPDVPHHPDPRGTAPDRILAMIDLLMYLAVEGILEYGPQQSSGYRSGDPDEKWTRLRFPPIVKQMPGERTIVTDAWLRRHDLWRTPGQIEGAVTGDKNHAMDAVRHLIVWLRKYNTGKAVL